MASRAWEKDSNGGCDSSRKWSPSFSRSGTILFSLCLFFLHFRCQPVWWTELNPHALALQDLPYKSLVMIFRACLMDLSRDSDLSQSARLKRKGFTGCLHTRTGCCRQLAAWTTNIQSFYLKHEPDARQCMGICSVRSQISHSEPVSGLQNACRDLHAFTSWLGSSLASWGPSWHLKTAPVSASIGSSLPIKLCKDLFMQVPPHLRACHDTG